MKLAGYLAPEEEKIAFEMMEISNIGKRIRDLRGQSMMREAIESQIIEEILLDYLEDEECTS